MPFVRRLEHIHNMNCHVQNRPLFYSIDLVKNIDLNSFNNQFNDLKSPLAHSVSKSDSLFPFTLYLLVDCVSEFFIIFVTVVNPKSVGYSFKFFPIDSRDVFLIF